MCCKYCGGSSSVADDSQSSSEEFEVIDVQAADIWSAGVVLYEMVSIPS